MQYICECSSENRRPFTLGLRASGKILSKKWLLRERLRTTKKLVTYIVWFCVCILWHLDNKFYESLHLSDSIELIDKSLLLIFCCCCCLSSVTMAVISY